MMGLEHLQTSTAEDRGDVQHSHPHCCCSKAILDMRHQTPFSTPAKGCHHRVLWRSQPQKREHFQEHPRLRHQRSLCGVGKVESPHLTSPEVGVPHRWLRPPPLLLLLPLRVAATAVVPATPEIGYDLLEAHLAHIHLARQEVLACPMAAVVFCLDQIQLPGAPGRQAAHRSELGDVRVLPEVAHMVAFDPNPDQDFQCGPAPC